MDETYAVLRWTCTRCGWSYALPMPGFAGDGYSHYDDGHTPCGPLVALRVGGDLHMSPGASSEEIAAALTIAEGKPARSAT